MGMENAPLLLSMNNSEYLWAIGVVLCIIFMTILMKSPSLLSNYSDQSILMKIKNDFRIRTKAVEDISKVQDLTDHVREQTEIIRTSVKNWE